eukprot:1055589-Alexandrium_andersonii.AAC.1
MTNGDAAALKPVARTFSVAVNAVVAERAEFDKAALAKAAKSGKLELRAPAVTNAGDVEGGTAFKAW